MGKAYVGIADDVNSLYYNIAGIARMTSITLSATYSKLYTGVPGLNGGFVGYIQPLGESNEYGCVGINWTHLNVSESAASATILKTL